MTDLPVVLIPQRASWSYRLGAQLSASPRCGRQPRNKSRRQTQPCLSPGNKKPRRGGVGLDREGLLIEQRKRSQHAVNIFFFLGEYTHVVRAVVAMESHENIFTSGY